jgi:hypothetical protein
MFNYGYVLLPDRRSEEPSFGGSFEQPSNPTIPYNIDRGCHQKASDKLSKQQ